MINTVFDTNTQSFKNSEVLLINQYVVIVDIWHKQTSGLQTMTLTVQLNGSTVAHAAGKIQARHLLSAAIHDTCKAKLDLECHCFDDADLIAAMPAHNALFDLRAWALHRGCTQNDWHPALAS